MTRSISHATNSPAGDALSEYQKGMQTARGFLRAMFSRNAARNTCDTGAKPAPEHPDQQR
ncbi:hypothetical protein ACTHR6_06070 [Ralstonia holmesii]|uniref:hypothetical protein n=1 Tax=Ralstonia TaxID=48736 RepID=UPI000A7714DC|nr:hypothetical protein [Ralstonia pickettii]